jgi:small subunit ribosomal protein S17
MADTNTPATTEERGRRRTLIGTVTRDKGHQTRRVDVERLAKHPRYGKYIKKRTVCYVHDVNNDSHIGDTVEIIECRPISKTKHWRLVRVVKQAPTQTPVKAAAVEAPAS